MPDHASVTNGPKLGKMIYGNIGAGHINGMRAFLRAFDQLVQGTVKAVNQNTPPGSPANGDAYIVGSAPTGAWAGHAGKIAVWSTEIATTDTDTKVPAWEFYTPREGWLVYVEQDDALMLYNGTAWTFDFKLAGIPQFAGTNTTGSGSASLGANCPAVTPTAPYTWIQVKTADGSTAYIPAWK
jgi:hypothetical protein